MRVRCPQCGREEDVPSGRAGSLHKCSCKFSYRLPKPSSTQEASESSNHTPKESVAPSIDHAELLPEEEWKETDSDVSNYIESLHQLKTSLKKQEQEKAEKEVERISLPSFREESIEIADRPKTASSDKDLEVSEATESVQEKLEPESPQAQEQETGRHPVWRESFVDLEHLKDRLFEYFQEPIRASIAGGLVLIFMSLLVLISLGGSSDTDEGVTDPYLLSLLEPRPDSSPAPQPQQTQSRPPRVASGEKKTPRPRSPAPQGSSQSLTLALQSMYAGRFQEVQSMGTRAGSSVSMKALGIEAALLNSRVSAAQKRRLGQGLDRLAESAPQSTFLIRAVALRTLINDGQAEEALRQLESLALTRSRDPLVFAYIGLAYQKLGNQRLAINHWNQALTLQQNFPWVDDEKNKALQELQAERSP